MVINGPAERTLLLLAVRHYYLLLLQNINLGLFLHIVPSIYNAMM